MSLPTIRLPTDILFRLLEYTLSEPKFLVSKQWYEIYKSIHPKWKLIGDTDVLDEFGVAHLEIIEKRIKIQRKHIMESFKKIFNNYKNCNIRCEHGKIIVRYSAVNNMPTDYYVIPEMRFSCTLTLMLEEFRIDIYFDKQKCFTKVLKYKDYTKKIKKEVKGKIFLYIDESSVDYYWEEIKDLLSPISVCIMQFIKI